MAHTNIPDALDKIKTRTKDVPWYNASMGSKLGEPARQLLEEYSKIPADEVEPHIYAIRDEAWQIWPYPCIGQFRFLDLALSLNPHYQHILSFLKTSSSTPPIFLDLGCCFGQDLRKLVYDGVPSTSLYGCDLRPEYFDLGYKLFKDKSTLKARFITSDIFDSSSELFQVLAGKVDILNAGSFLHLFDYNGQVEVCKAMIKLLKDKQGAMVVGRQVGSRIVGERVHRTNKSQTMFRHNGESFKKMWRDIGEMTGTKWRVEVDEHLVEPGTNGKGGWEGDEELLRIGFAIFREG